MSSRTRKQMRRPGRTKETRQPQPAPTVKVALDLGRLGRTTPWYRTVDRATFKVMLNEGLNATMEAAYEERLHILNDVLPIRLITPRQFVTRERRNRYNRSAKGQAGRARYAGSEKARARARKYNVSEAGARRNIRYNGTDKGRTRIRKYEATTRRRAYKVGYHALLNRSPYRADVHDLAAVCRIRPDLAAVPLEYFLATTVKPVQYQEPVAGRPGMMRLKTRLVPVPSAPLPSCRPPKLGPGTRLAAGT
jgi:hypothetical protein